MYFAVARLERKRVACCFTSVNSTVFGFVFLDDKFVICFAGAHDEIDRYHLDSEKSNKHAHEDDITEQKCVRARSGELSAIFERHEIDHFHTSPGATLESHATSDIARTELFVWLWECTEVKLLPRACDAGWHDELICEELTNSWDVGTSTDNEDLFYFSIVDETLVVVAMTLRISATIRSRLGRIAAEIFACRGPGLRPLRTLY